MMFRISSQRILHLSSRTVKPNCKSIGCFRLFSQIPQKNQGKNQLETEKSSTNLTSKPTPTSKSPSKPPPKIPSSSTHPATTSEGAPIPTRDELHQQILKDKRPKNVIEIYFLARKYKIELERSDYLTIFKAFLTKYVGNEYYHHTAVFNVYEKIKHDKIWTMEIFRYAIKLFETYKLVNELLELDQAFDSTFSPNAEHTDLMLNAFITCQSETHAWTQYNVYRSKTILATMVTTNTHPGTQPSALSSNEKWKLPQPSTFISLCELLCQKNLNLRATSVLRDFCEAYSLKEEGDNTPARAATSPQCLDKTIHFLNTALSSHEMMIITTILNWIVSENITLPQGIMQKIFEVCAAAGRPDLLESAVYLQSQYGRILTPAEHAHLIIGYCRFGSMEKAVEKLILAEAAGVNFVKGTFYPPELTPTQQDIDITTANFAASYSPFYIQDSLASLIRHIGDLDRLYYALIDLSADGIRPPVLALNATLQGAGRVASLDRSFALIQEYDTVFHTQPSLESYCALIDAVARSNPPRVSVLFAIFQEMEENFYKPNSHCYSTLIEVMILANEVGGVNDVLAHMEASQIQPSWRSLRRLAIYYAKQGMEDKVKEICDRIFTLTQRSLPVFFVTRLNYIREKLKKENSTSSSSSSSSADPSPALNETSSS